LITATGTVTGGNILTAGLISATGNVFGNYFIGNGSQLTGVTASSVDANALTGNTLNSSVLFSSLTTVGTLTSLNVTGNSTGGNLTTAGIVTATGNVQGGNISTAGLVTATGNVTGGNILTAGLISATSSVTSAANVVGGNISTAGLITATGNVTGGNISTAGVVSATGNVTGGNLLTAGLVSATGNITGANLNITGNISDTGALIISTGSDGNLTLDPNGAGAVIINKDLLNGQANGVGNIGNATGYFNTIFAQATSAQYADLAELYLADAPLEPGTVVMFGGDKEVQSCNTDMCNKVAGVISTRPAYQMNSGLVGDYATPVALMGRVPCLVQGTVARGDMMVSAGNGRARAESHPVLGSVIGKALESFDGNFGTIEIVVGRL
jgi:hypothetical protein